MRNLVEGKKLKLDEKIVNLIGNRLVSASQLSRETGLEKKKCSLLLEELTNSGRLDSFFYGKTRVYTISKEGSKKREAIINTRIIGIVSGKGGTGKTVTTLNLAGALQEFKRDTIAIDADVKMAGIGLHLGTYNFSETLNTVVKDNRNILEALYIHSSGLRVIPASLSPESINFSTLKKMLSQISEKTIVLIDSPPGIEENSLNVMNLCKEIIVVTLPETQSMANSIKIMDIAREMKIKITGIILNRCHSIHRPIILEAENIFEAPLLGTVPEDKNIQKSILKKIPNIFLEPFSPSSLAYKKIAGKLIGEDYRKPKIPLFGKLKVI